MGDDLPDPAAWINDIARSPRDHVNVSVTDGLAGGGTIVDANREAVWL